MELFSTFTFTKQVMESALIKKLQPRLGHICFVMLWEYTQLIHLILLLSIFYLQQEKGGDLKVYLHSNHLCE